MEASFTNSTAFQDSDWKTWDHPLRDWLLDLSTLSDGCFVTAFAHPRLGEGWLVLSNPVETHAAWAHDEVRPLLDRVDRWTASGGFAAGCVAYEAAPSFDSAFEVHPHGKDLLAIFHLYDSPPAFYKELLVGKQPDHTDPAWKAGWDESLYTERFNEARNLIGNGTTYQVNLTFRLSCPYEEHLPSLFARLAADDPPAYASLFLSAPINLASLSPELFFDQSSGVVKCKPMKGTAPLGATTRETNKHAEALKTSEKNRAENLMVVDMIRNDLGRIADIGSVTVPSLFDVEQLSTVLQMTSTVEAKFNGSALEVFDALFPCASIVGAPKVSTMRIIHRLEDTPRGIYTGAIGILGPQRSSRFSVAIRTISQRLGEVLKYGVGSGIVWDSSSEAEWAENALKAVVLNRSSLEFGLFETIHWPPRNEGRLLPLHLKRLSAAAAQFGIPFDPQAAENLLHKELDDLTDPARIKLSLFADGKISITTVPLGNVPELLRFAIALSPVASEDPSLAVKSTRRKIYERHLRGSVLDEVLLWNERGEVTEFCKGNVVVRIGDDLVTPPLQSGLLGGVYREWLLSKGEIREGVLLVSDIPQATEIYRINALAGKVLAELELND